MPGYSGLSRALIERALQGPLPGEPAQVRMATRPRVALSDGMPKGPPRLAAVLLLLFEQGGEPHFVLTRRTDDLRNHGGQIALPGGAVEPSDPSLWAAALREAQEELGIDDLPQEAAYLGRLSPSYVASSHFAVHPFVGWLPRDPSFAPCPEEVAEVLVPPVALLLDDSAKGEEVRLLHGQEAIVPYYRWQGQIIWGLTAMILSEFEVLLHQALADLKGEGIA